VYWINGGHELEVRVRSIASLTWGRSTTCSTSPLLC